jgi:peroxiredoxin Q/BCP
MLKEGDKAIDFKLQGIDNNGNEKIFSLKDLLDKNLILYFYPKDNTPGCTIEACDFRDSFNALVSKDCNVAGVSPDSVDSHIKFKEKQNLIFPLLSDPDKKIAETYGAYGEKKLYGKTAKGIIRSTYLISKDGTVKKIWHNVKAKGHVSSVLSFLF